MPATRGFENGQAVKIYDNPVVINQTEIDIALQKNDPLNHKPPEPCVVTKVYIEAKAPQAKSGYNGPITEKLKKEFPMTWGAFQKNLDSPEKRGTPIESIPDISTSMIDKIKASGIQTLEDLVSIDDTTASRLPMGIKMRNKARLILQSMDDDKLDDTIDQVAELKEIILRQQQELDAIKAPVVGSAQAFED